jgi:cation diffusion facilitator family transporter
VAVGLAVLAIKLLAWQLTGSVALFSDALESIVNVAASTAALLAISYGARPADANHPYGHHKAEYFSVVLEGVLIIVAAILILREACRFLSPRCSRRRWGLVVGAIASAINGTWCGT